MLSKKYDEIFGDDKDDRHYKTEIQKVEPSKMRQVLQDMLDTINSLPLGFSAWAKFKWDMLEAEKELGVTLFVWSKPPTQKGKPYISIDVNWDLLHTSQDYFMAWMTIESNNVLPGLNSVANNPWSLVGKPPDEESDNNGEDEENPPAHLYKGSIDSLNDLGSDDESAS